MMSLLALSRRIGWALLLGCICIVGTAWPAELRGRVRPVVLLSSQALHPARMVSAQSDTFLICFQDSLTAITNPACFSTPTHPADCISHSTHYFVQYMFPDFAVPHQVLGMGFLSNDGATVFPSAGVLLLPIHQNGVDFPRAGQLDSLQVRNIDTPGDLAVVSVDLQAANIIVPAGNDYAIVVALQFPQGGELTAVGVGPGIAVDNVPPDQDCDYFTLDGGTYPDERSWNAPCWNDPRCPTSREPIDWGFVVDLAPMVSIEDITWTRVKGLYRTP